MKGPKQVLVIGSCIQILPNGFDIRFRGYYLGNEIRFVRVYTNTIPAEIELGAEFVLNLEVICCLGNVLETRMVGLNLIE